MSVSQRKDGRWLVKYKEADTWKQRAFRDEAEARQFDINMSDKLLQQSNARLTLGELALAYLQNHIIHRETKQHIISCLCGKNGEFLRDKYAEELTRRDLEQLRNNYRTHCASNNTINKYQAYIRAILAWGVEQELIRFNPWRDYKKLPVKRKPVSVNFNDLQKLYQVMPAWLQWAVKTAFCLCLRPGLVELFSLRWTAFLWQRGIVTVIQGKSGIPKNVIPPDVYMQEAWTRFQEDTANGIELVCTRNGKPVHNYQKDWLRACQKANVTMRPYDIRHLAATQMLASGADLAAVAAQLGHASVAVTGQTYAHVIESGQRKAAAGLPCLF